MSTSESEKALHASSKEVFTEFQLCTADGILFMWEFDFKLDASGAGSYSMVLKGLNIGDEAFKKDRKACFNVRGHLIDPSMSGKNVKLFISTGPEFVVAMRRR